MICPRCNAKARVSRTSSCTKGVPAEVVRRLPGHAQALGALPPSALTWTVRKQSCQCGWETWTLEVPAKV